MANALQTCLDIHHPEFRRGYQDGRDSSSHQAIRLTDKHVVEGILQIANAGEKQQNVEKMYYAIGFFFGVMSASVLPHQKDEEDAKAVEEAFLQEVKEKYEDSGEDLVLLIQDQWDRHDLLAEKLDAPTFVRMLNRGKKQQLFMEGEGEE